MTEAEGGVSGRRFVFSSWIGRVLLALLGCALCLWTMVLRGALTVNLGPVVLQPLPALVALVGLLGGPVAVAGCVIGFIAYQTLQGVPSAWEGVGYLVLGVSTYVLWGRFGQVRFRKPPQLRSSAEIREFLVVALLGALSSAVVTTWGYEIFGAFPFYPTALFVTLGQFASVALVGGFVLAVVPRVVGESRWRVAVETVRLPHRQPAKNGRAWTVVTGGILAVWLLVGSAASVAVQVVELIPPYYLRLYGLDSLLWFTAGGALGRTATAFQVGLGACLVALWILSLYRCGLVERPHAR